MGCAPSSAAISTDTPADTKLISIQPVSHHHKLSATNNNNFVIALTDQHGTAQTIDTSANTLSHNCNTSHTLTSDINSFSNTGSRKTKSAALGLASQRRPTIHKPSTLPSSRTSAQHRGSLLESPKTPNKSLLQSVKNVFSPDKPTSNASPSQQTKQLHKSSFSHKIVNDPKTVNDYESMCIQCYNCEQFNVGYVCESCKPDDNTMLPLLCRACNVGMHQFGKTSLHVRRVLTCHTADNPNTQNSIASEFNQLLCYNCDVPYPTTYCMQCNHFMCHECSNDIHMPQKLQSHIRLSVPSHMRYVHTATTQHVQSNAKLLKSMKFNQHPMLNAQQLQSPQKLTPNNTYTTPSSKSVNNDKQPKLTTKKSMGAKRPSVSLNPKQAKTINNAVVTQTLLTTERRKPKCRAPKVLLLKTDIQPIRNKTAVEGNVFVFSDPTCKDALHEQQYEFRNTINKTDKQGLVDIVSIQCGPTHSAAITAYGSLFMWGNNMEHQIGYAADGYKHCDEPVQIEFERHNPVKQIACGYNHNIALCHDNSVHTWGTGLMGVLGTGSDEDQYKPCKLQLQHYTSYDEDMDDSKAVDNSADEQIVYVAAGQYNTGIVVKGRSDSMQVYMFGEGASGQLGNGKSKPSLFPTLICIDKQQTVVGLSIGSKHCAAWTATGDVYTWGSNEFGQLGYLLAKSLDDLSGAANVQLTPKRVDQLCVMSLKAQSVHCSERHTSILTTTGQIYSCGSGETHQLGIFDNVDSVIPVKAVGLNHKVIHMSVGSSITMCITENGQCYGWGYSLETPIPTLIEGLKGKFLQQVCIGQNDTVCVLSGCSNDIYEWQFDGTTLDGTLADTSQPTKPPSINKALRGKRIAVFAAGKLHYAAASSDGRIYTWGDNTDYQLGLPSTANITYMPLPVEIKLKHNVIDIQCGTEHTLALTSDGIVLSWGTGQDGKLGHQKSSDVYEPKIIEHFINHKLKIKYIAVGPSNSACITETGLLYMFGSNSKGQCGVGDYSPHFQPALCTVLQNEQCKKICIGYQHCIILTQSHKIYTCGDNTFGQLGLGLSDDTESYNKPQEMRLLNMNNKLPADIACGDNVTAVMNTAGQLYMCGNGETKQQCHCIDTKQQTYCNELEDIRVMTDVQLPFMLHETIQSISINSIDCCCVTTAGNIYAWGWNFSTDDVCIKLDYYPDTANEIGMQPNDKNQRFQKIVLGCGRLMLQS